MDFPSVTVIIPCHNAERFIEDALRSVLGQGYPGELDVVVVDDGCTDRSPEVARRFDGVQVLCQPNQGPAAARNRGVKAARGQLIAFLDADDEWLPGSLMARVQALMADPTVSVAFGDVAEWVQGADPSAAVPMKLPDAVMPAVRSGWLYPHILLDTILSIISAVVRREVFDRVGLFDESRRVGEDYEFWVRVSQDHRFHHVDEVVARYRRHAQGTTQHVRGEPSEYLVVRDAVERYGIQEREGLPFDPALLRGRLHRLCFYHGYWQFWGGRPDIAARSLRLALGYRRLHLKTWIYWALSVARAAVSRSRPPDSMNAVSR